MNQSESRIHRARQKPTITYLYEVSEKDIIDALNNKKIFLPKRNWIYRIISYIKGKLR